MRHAFYAASQAVKGSGPLMSAPRRTRPDSPARQRLIEATAKVFARTGVEMEALTAVSVAALTVYDMCKALDRGMRIEAVRLVRKSGGKSGDWEAEPCTAHHDAARSGPTGTMRAPGKLASSSRRSFPAPDGTMQGIEVDLGRSVGDHRTGAGEQVGRPQAHQPRQPAGDCRLP